MKPHLAHFRFHDCLEDFLLPEQRKQFIPYSFPGNPAIKDPVEALGVPHSEVGDFEVNRRSVEPGYQLQDGDRVEVFPRHSLDGETRFIVDVNLGRLARYLRLLGFDTAWRNDLLDAEIAQTSVKEERIILTRDRRLLFRREITRGYWVRTVLPDRQVPEVFKRLDLWQDIQPFRRCAICNGLIQVVAKEAIVDKLEPLTRKYYQEFYRCAGCGQIYWKGSHYAKLMKKIEQFRNHA
ncbi:Mut7-C RNAse domain-containing protein [Thiolapillus sp.]